MAKADLLMVLSFSNIIFLVPSSLMIAKALFRDDSGSFPRIWTLDQILHSNLLRNHTPSLVQ